MLISVFIKEQDNWSNLVFQVLEGKISLVSHLRDSYWTQPELDRYTFLNGCSVNLADSFFLILQYQYDIKGKFNLDSIITMEFDLAENMVYNHSND